ncbi:thioredoxin family protein [Noviherbaspirillum galbum]|uniref:Thioredoxin family protein n=1 Tax=Noviherbaspirillum galbum TaxID=2709383 RepID=A0A6B3SGS9_9BURK|nr:thioredoxin family protein [Noviherbaspirillum galbum]NEX60074.1 thioredoxin family protein [Noviherbaspirillum galbum]
MKKLNILAVAFTFFTAIASAADPAPYTQATFDKLAKEGKPVVVDVSATWCPTCKAQKPIVEDLSKQAPYKDVSILMVDFDADKAVLKQFKVTSQSTLIAFQGGKETGRSVGDTSPAGIETIFKKAAN